MDSWGTACVTIGRVVHVVKRPKTELLALRRVLNARQTRSGTVEPLRAGRQTAVSAGSELAAGGVMYTPLARPSREKVTPVNPCLTGQLR